MEKAFAILLFIISVNSNAQVICGTANENGSITLTAPLNNAFTGIEFASYGTPNGACNSFTLGSCHAANSQSIVETIFIGQNTATINATNGVFGDPCGGTVKRLYIQARYSSILPLTLVSFTAQHMGDGKIKLSWLSEDEFNTSQFIIEKSTDGILFEARGFVPAKGSGSHAYSFTDMIFNIPDTYYYRLKMVDRDGRYKYSSIVHIKNEEAGIRLDVFPNPATEYINIVSSNIQEAVIINMAGKVTRHLLLVHGRQALDVSSYIPGMYVIKSSVGVIKFIKK